MYTPVFGAPPEDLSGSAIGGFFTAAPFAPVVSEEFLAAYAGKQPAWGPVGYVTYKRTYARPLYPQDLDYPLTRSELDEHGIEKAIYLAPDGSEVDEFTVIRYEEFFETLTRVLNGLWHILRCHAARRCIDFSEETARRKAQAEFERMWAFKWLPPGRGLWMMGTRFMYLKGNAALNNCGFASTANIETEFSEPFGWVMDMSMLGVGPGFDTRGAWDHAARLAIDAKGGPSPVTVKRPPNLDFTATPANFDRKTRVIKTAYKLPARKRIEVTIGGEEVTAAVESIDEYRARIAEELGWAVPRSTETTTHTMLLDENYLTSDSQLHLLKTYSVISADRRQEHTVWRKGAKKPIITSQHKIWLIPDSREGWVKSVRMLIDAFLKGEELPVFDYSAIRPKGTPIRGFGGIAEGPEFLQICHENLVCFFLDRIGQPLSEADITDIMNEIGACVVSGNVRRSAQIALGLPGNEQFIALKHDPVNHPACWNSNNTVFAKVGMSYDRIADLIATRGEPGLFWIENSRAYGRMGDPPDHKDLEVMGTNPCGEQPLHNYELCCLVENFPSNAQNEEDFLLTLKQSYLYAKAVTLVPSHNKRTNKVMGTNGRIGSSLSGIQGARAKFSTRRFLKMIDLGHAFIRDVDTRYSIWLQVRPAIKRCSIKPSGTLSLLVGCEAGIHYKPFDYGLRRIRFSKSSPMIPVIQAAGYRVYDAPEQPESTVVIDFPVRFEQAGKTEAQAAESIWEQLEFAAQVQALWCDNQLSITVKFKQPVYPSHSDYETDAEYQAATILYERALKDLAAEITRALELYETRLKSVSFLAHFEPPDPTSITEEDEDMLLYKAAPYQPITQAQYAEEIAGLRPYTFSVESDELLTEGCDLGVCPVR